MLKGLANKSRSQRKETVKTYKQTELSKTKVTGMDEENEMNLDDAMEKMKKEKAAADKKKKDKNEKPKMSNAEKLAESGEWGSQKVAVSNLLMQGTSKVGYQNKAFSREQVEKAKHRLRQIYEFNGTPPENFVAQMAFTTYNGFLLTTCGRLFSWGEQGPCLGR